MHILNVHEACSHVRPHAPTALLVRGQVPAAAARPCLGCRGHCRSAGTAEGFRTGAPP